ncbi:MAG: PIF1 family DEAD/DEAH box helicase [Bacteroidota bacterium]
MQALELSDDFKYVLDLVEKTNASIFVTGRAGTGKSTLLQLFRNTTRKKAVVLAPTGIAALNVQGQTIHSFFRFPAKLLTAKDINKRRDRRLYRNMEVMVIDEISMVRADLLDHIDRFLRINRDNHLPFGGVQVVFFGDLFQLPPVIANDIERNIFSTYYDSPYFFSAKVFEQFEMEKIELRKVYRQEARYFIRLLDAVRTNRLDRDDLLDLNERHVPDFESEDFYITLSARNITVDRINKLALERIPMPVHQYFAYIKGDFAPRLFPTEQILKLKLNAQVMFVRNDPDKQFVNGTIGKVVKLEAEAITVMVETQDGRRRYVDVRQIEWEILRYKMGENGKIESQVVGTFTQYPLRLAWAITIHKSQGKTFDRVIIDLGKGAFEHGQTYVALSRCRTLEGIVLRHPLKWSDIRTDERIVSYYEQNF